jgi:hypothetical protein
MLTTGSSRFVAPSFRRTTPGCGLFSLVRVVETLVAAVALPRHPMIPEAVTPEATARNNARRFML